MTGHGFVKSMLKTFCARLIAIALAAAPQLVAHAHAPAFQNPAPTAEQRPAAPTETAEGLRSRILAHISQPRYGPAAWGIKIVSLDTGKTVFEQNAGKYFSPASNAKLYTSALALDHLDADYRIKTSLYAAGRPTAEGALKGDLIIYGRGDPTIAASLNGGDYYKALEPLAEQLALSGVRRIEGDLIGDESFFKGPPMGSGWEWEDLQWYYGAEVSALTINDNALDLKVVPAERAGIPCRVSTGPPTSFVTIINRTQTAAKGTEPRIVVYRPVGENIIYVSGRLPLGDKGYNGAVAVHNPAGLFVAMFKDALARRGIFDHGPRAHGGLEVSRSYTDRFREARRIRLDTVSAGQGYTARDHEAVAEPLRAVVAFAGRRSRVSGVGRRVPGRRERGPAAGADNGANRHRSYESLSPRGWSPAG